MIWALLENFVRDISYVSDSENENEDADDDSNNPFEDNALQTQLLKSYVADSIAGFLDKVFAQNFVNSIELSQVDYFCFILIYLISARLPYSLEYFIQ